MKIKEHSHAFSQLETTSYKFVSRTGEICEESEPVLREHHVDVFINDALTLKLICVPEYLPELVLGRLLTEGIIHSVEDIKELSVDPSGECIHVLLNAGQPASSDHVITTVHPISWEVSWIFDLADKFAEGMPLHSQTYATHSCFLAQNGVILFGCEDLGRHNALDKVIGYALRHQIDLANCIVYSSGRIPTEMVLKAIRARIPILVSKASPTSSAIELARKYQLTLICAARRDRMKIFYEP